jgi:hypothetical protein
MADMRSLQRGEHCIAETALLGPQASFNSQLGSACAATGSRERDRMRLVPQLLLGMELLS